MVCLSFNHVYKIWKNCKINYLKLYQIWRANFNFHIQPPKLDLSDDLYTQMMSLQRQLELYEIQEGAQEAPAHRRKWTAYGRVHSSLATSWRWSIRTTESSSRPLAPFTASFSRLPAPSGCNAVPAPGADSSISFLSHSERPDVYYSVSLIFPVYGFSSSNRDF